MKKMKLIHLSLITSILFLVAILYKWTIRTHHTQTDFLRSIAAAKNMVSSYSSWEKNFIQYRLREAPDLRDPVNNAIDSMIILSRDAGDAAYSLLARHYSPWPLEEYLEHHDVENNRKIPYDIMVKQGGFDTLCHWVHQYNRDVENVFRQTVSQIQGHRMVDNFDMDSMVNAVKATLPGFDESEMKQAFKHATFIEMETLLQKIRLDFTLSRFAWIRALAAYVREPEPDEINYYAIIYAKKTILKLGEGFEAEAVVAGMLMNLDEQSSISVNGKKYSIPTEGFIYIKERPSKPGKYALNLSMDVIRKHSMERIRSTTSWEYEVME